MEQSADNTELKDKINSSLKNNKGKIFTFILLLILTAVFVFIMKEINKKKNNLISEKYIQASSYLNNGNKELSKKIGFPSPGNQQITIFHCSTQNAHSHQTLRRNAFFMKF